MESLKLVISDIPLFKGRLSFHFVSSQSILPYFRPTYNTFKANQERFLVFTTYIEKKICENSLDFTDHTYNEDEMILAM